MNPSEQVKPYAIIIYMILNLDTCIIRLWYISSIKSCLVLYKKVGKVLHYSIFGLKTKPFIIVINQAAFSAEFIHSLMGVHPSAYSLLALAAILYLFLYSQGHIVIWSGGAVKLLKLFNKQDMIQITN